MGHPRWAPHVVPTWVINGKCVHGLKMGYIWDPICFMKYTSANIITFTFTFNHLADAFIQSDVQMRRTIEAIRPSREQQYTSALTSLS